MTLKTQNIFHSKIMLFGEYSILMGSMGLTIPFSHFNGQLTFTNNNSYTDLDFAKTSNLQLIDYCKFLIKNKASIGEIINVDKLKHDLQNDLFFESTIPESYGLGSSGALVAAIYHSYARHKIEANPYINSTQLNTLKSQLGELESYFHGTSSGIDPLICYMNHPLCIENTHNISAVDLPLSQIKNGDAIFLLNTGKPGKTAPLVKLFMKKIGDLGFKNFISAQLIPSTNSAIKALIQGNIPDFIIHLQTLSISQLNHFREMIPKNIISIWKQGLKSELFTLKLCGSGGGGYVLGFTREYTKTKSFLKSKNLEIIPVYQSIRSV